MQYDSKYNSNGRKLKSNPDPKHKTRQQPQ